MTLDELIKAAQLLREKRPEAGRYRVAILVGDEPAAVDVALPAVAIKLAPQSGWVHVRDSK